MQVVAAVAAVKVPALHPLQAESQLLAVETVVLTQAQALQALLILVVVVVVPAAIVMAAHILMFKLGSVDLAS
jgi:hypothetical protein